MPTKSERGTLWDFLTSPVLQNIETNEGRPVLHAIKSSKSRIVLKKNPSEKHQSRCFCIGRGFGVSSMFWTSVVQVDVVEQMNKEVDLMHLKKLPTVIVRLIFY